MAVVVTESVVIVSCSNVQPTIHSLSLRYRVLMKYCRFFIEEGKYYIVV